MDINEYLANNKLVREVGKYTYRNLAPRITCTDGFTMSVQVSHSHYCTPREDDAAYYEDVEVGYPSAIEELLMPFCEDADHPTDTVYGYVPVKVVDLVINKHGGIKE